MADKYVAAGGSNTSPYDTWAKAATSLATATAAAAAGETIFVDSAFNEAIIADQTYTMAAGVRIISTASADDTYATGATISTTTSGADVLFAGATNYSVYGVTFSLGDSTDTNTISTNSTNGGIASFYDCNFTLGGNNANGGVTTGGNSTNAVYFEKCNFSWAGTGQGFLIVGRADFNDCDMSAGAAHPSVLFEAVGVGGSMEIIGCDLSDITTIVETTPSTASITLRQCSLKSGYTLIAPATVGLGEVYAFDCAVGDSHVAMHHVNYFGSTVISATVYANDNIADSALSWVVASTANATKAFPYRSPWISAYHSGTSAITPYLEALRSGSTTAYNKDEVWVEMTVKDATNTSRVNLYSNRSDPLTTGAANTASAKAAGDWAGEHVSDNAFMKLQIAAVTPTDPGYISARIGIAAANTTVYVDPQLRGLS